MTSPNMVGIQGTAQRLLNPHVYDRHVPLTLEQMIEAHRSAGLGVEKAAYIGGMDFHVLNLHVA